MKRYELKIEVLNKDYVDSLIVSLARQGYAPYIGYDDNIYIEVDSEQLQELK